MCVCGVSDNEPNRFLFFRFVPFHSAAILKSNVQLMDLRVHTLMLIQRRPIVYDSSSHYIFQSIVLCNLHSNGNLVMEITHSVIVFFDLFDFMYT